MTKDNGIQLYRIADNIYTDSTDHYPTVKELTAIEYIKDKDQGLKIILITDKEPVFWGYSDYLEGALRWE